jgi:hypothetical protein
MDNRIVSGLKPVRMTQEDLRRYDPEGEADRNLRAALRDASEQSAAALHKLLTGTTVATRKAN